MVLGRLAQEEINSALDCQLLEPQEESAENAP